MRELTLTLTENEYETIHEYMEAVKTELSLEDFIFDCVEEKLKTYRANYTNRLANLEDEVKGLKTMLFKMNKIEPKRKK